MFTVAVVGARTIDAPEKKLKTNWDDPSGNHRTTPAHKFRKRIPAYSHPI